MDVFGFVISFLGIIIAAGLLIIVFVEFIIKQQLKKLNNTEKIILKILTKIHEIEKYPYKLSEEQKVLIIMDMLNRDKTVKADKQKLYLLVNDIVCLIAK